MTWLKISFLASLCVGHIFLSCNNYAQGSPIEDPSTSSNKLTVPPSNSVYGNLKVKRTGAEDLANVESDASDNTNVEMFATIGLDRETGEWQKINLGRDYRGNQIDQQRWSRTWRDFSGIREESPTDWLTYSEILWNNAYRSSGVADVKNVGTFGLHTCTGVLLISDRYVIMSHIPDGYGFDPVAAKSTDYIDSISRAQIEAFNYLAMNNIEKLQNARFYVTKYGGRTAPQKWVEIVRYLARPMSILFRDVTWFDHGMTTEVAARISNNAGAKMLLSGAEDRIFTQAYSGAAVEAAHLVAATEEVASPVGLGASSGRSQKPPKPPQIPKSGRWRGRFWWL